MDVAAYDYDLPDDRVAQTPVEPRHAARLLVDDWATVAVGHHRVADLAGLLRPGDLVVVNDTRVIPARLHLRRASGAVVEVLLLEELGARAWEVLARPGRRIRPGEALGVGSVEEGTWTPVLEVGERLGEGRWSIRFLGDEAVERVLERLGEVPLPPYITAPLTDAERYQTVFARRPGSVAAPTAGLHLTPQVLEELRARGIEVARIELVVGLGTFRPITSDRVEDHRMHGERYVVPEETLAAIERTRARGGEVVAIGTTVVRALESWGTFGEVAGRTELFIHGDHRFLVVDRLLTNFHVPRSSLLVLLGAFVGDRWRALYEEALREGYRFLSFGDAMLVHRAHRR